MIKRTITFQDFDDNPATETLYFNVTQTELSEHLDLITTFEDLQKMFEGDERELSIPEVSRIVQFIKILMELSYGLREDGGKSFDKSDEIWRKFTKTAAYDAFTISLFEHPEEANEFMLGIFPKALMAAAQAQMKETETVELPQPKLGVVPETKSEIQDVPKKPQDMSREELLEAFRTKNETIHLK